MLYEFPLPPKPDSISHGDAEGGWNFAGSMGFIFEVPLGGLRCLDFSSRVRELWASLLSLSRCLWLSTQCVTYGLYTSLRGNITV